MSEVVLGQARRARQAARKLATLGTETKNAALNAMAEALVAQAEGIKDANAADITAGRERGLSEALLDRLTLNDKRIQAMAEGLRQIAALPDPIGQVIDGGVRPNGLELQRVRVPLGVIAVIYESRPNVTADAAGLCIKSGNAVILRGGSEAIHSNKALARLLVAAGERAGLPADSLQLIQTTDREAARVLMRAEGLVDVLIPRGGESLKKYVLENATVPVLTALGGNCHTYVDAGADLPMAADIAFNAKVSRPSVCNAMETLLVHREAAEALLPSLCERLAAAGVEIRGCERTRALYPAATPATEEDWATEYLALILAVRVVDSLDEALDHIARYGTGHSEAIVTRDYRAAQRFTREVDAACVFINASTRFNDGFEFGLGAEIGISTQKLHARGPIGLSQLTTYKTIVRGDGQVRI
ncbi:MAG TPA: glutamate-5-semialdehyde dehydrogenase [Chthonomonadaceae bacterium]|nr:glutamate-5-semialdehyde dehydrogenase [Chthonomonadaceae bacterium]